MKKSFISSSYTLQPLFYESSRVTRTLQLIKVDSINNQIQEVHRKLLDSYLEVT